MRLSMVALVGALAFQMVPASASAQLDEELIPAAHKFESPENIDETGQPLTQPDSQ